MTWERASGAQGGYPADASPFTTLVELTFQRRKI